MWIVNCLVLLWEMIQWTIASVSTHWFYDTYIFITFYILAVLDLFELADDDIAFIVMEEWSSQLATNSGPCCLGLFLSSMRQCIEVRK